MLFTYEQFAETFPELGQTSLPRFELAYNTSWLTYQYLPDEIVKEVMLLAVADFLAPKTEVKRQKTRYDEVEYHQTDGVSKYKDRLDSLISSCVYSKLGIIGYGYTY